MFQEISSPNDVNNEEIKSYLLNNPVESIVDLDDEANESFACRRFVLNNNNSRTVVLIECDGRLLEKSQDLQSQIVKLNTNIIKEWFFVKGFVRRIYEN